MRSVVKGWYVKKQKVQHCRSKATASQSQQPGHPPDWRGADAIHLIERSLSGLSGFYEIKGAMNYASYNLKLELPTTNTRWISKSPNLQISLGFHLKDLDSTGYSLGSLHLSQIPLSGSQFMYPIHVVS